MLPVKKTSLFTSCFVIAYKALAMNVYYHQMRKKILKNIACWVKDLDGSSFTVSWGISGNMLQGTQSSLLTSEIHSAVTKWHLSFCHRTSIWVTWPSPSNAWLFSCCKGFPLALGRAAQTQKDNEGFVLSCGFLSSCLGNWEMAMSKVRRIKEWSNFTITPWTQKG